MVPKVEKIPDAAMAATSAISDIVSGKLAFDAFVESLGPLVTSLNVEKRLEGYEKMIAVVEGLDTGFLSGTQLNFVAEFVRARLKDHSSLMSPTLRGIRALLNCDNLLEESASALLQSLFQEGNCQACGLDDRLVYYRIFSTALTKFPTLTRKLGSSFVLAFISAMDGERDPRGLVAAFPLHAAVAISVPAGPIVEDLFEVVACYFPVDFSPASEEDPRRISREELAVGLKRCLSSTAAFAPYCLPLIIEKLESTVASTKIDSLALLHACLLFYTNTDLGDYVKPLCKLLMDEILDGKDPSISSASVMCFGSLFAAAEVPPILNPVDELLEEIYKEWTRHFGNPMERMVIPASSMWIAVLSKSDGAKKQFSDRSFKQIVFGLRKVDLPSHELIPILGCAIDFFHAVNLDSLKDLEEREACVVALLKLSVDPSNEVRSNVFEAVGAFLPACTEEEIDLIVSYLGAAAVTEKDDLAIAGICSCIKCLIQRDSSRGGERTVALAKRILVSMLKDIGDAAANVQNEDDSFLPVGARCLWATSSDGKSLRAATDSLLGAANGWAQSGGGEKDPNSTVAAAKCVAVLRQLWRDATAAAVPAPAKKTTAVGDGGGGLSSSLPNALKRVVAFAVDHSDTLAADSRIPCDLAEALAVTLSFTDEEDIKFAAEALMSRAIPEISGSGDARKNLSVLRLLEPLMTRVTESPVVESFVTSLVKEAVKSTNADFVFESSCRLIAGVINRLGDDEIIAPLLAELTDQTEAPESFKVGSGQKFYLACWVTLSLGLRNHPGFRSWLRKLLHTLESGTETEVAEKGFGILFQDLSSGPLSPGSGANYNPLLKQKTFLLVLPNLVEGIRNKNEACAAALVPILRNLPVSVLSGCQDQVVPCLVLALNSLPPESILSCLVCLSHLMRDSLELLVPHIDTLVPRMLSFCQYEGNMKVRIEALNCLKILAEGPEIHMIPLKPQIVRELRPILADKKRLVRKAAADARCAWYLIGELS